MTNGHSNKGIDVKTKENMEKQLEKYRYRALVAETENAAIKGSKAFRIIKLIGSFKNDFKKNPVGLTKKAAKILLTQPQKVLFKGKNRETVTQSLIDQTNKYQEWILLNEPQEEDLKKQAEESGTFKYKPLISIITPVFNPPIKVLEDLIESVLEQTYPNFELCLGDFGDDNQVKQLIKKYADMDNRIKNWVFSENRGIAGNSNAILKKVSGEYIGLLDHDDTLSPDALYENVKALNNRKYDFIYSDKDKIDEKNHRFDPLFKATFSPEMLININYLTHFNIMRTDLVKQVGGWDSSTDGAQDWDLFLKVTAEAKNIYHIPKILYHWRVIASSTAHSIETKPYALAGQRRSVDKYLKKMNLPARSVHHKTELIIDWDQKLLPSNPIVVIRSTSQVRTKYIIRKTLKEAPGAQFIQVASNNSDKNFRRDNRVIASIAKDTYSYEQIYKIAKDKSLNPEKRIFLFIDDSLKLEDDWYRRLLGWLSIEDVGAVSGRIVDKYDLIIDSGGVISGDTYQPIFSGFPRYYQSYIGNAEWVRNLRSISGLFFTTKGNLLKEYSETTTNPGSPQGYFDWLINNQTRLVMTPHCTSVTLDPGHVKESLKNIKLENKLMMTDEYSNPNVSGDDPMRLFVDEVLLSSEDERAESLQQYQKDAIILADSYDATQIELIENQKTLKRKTNSEPKSVALVLPSFDAIYAGLMNIFSFAEYLQTRQNLNVTFYILKDAKSANDEKKKVASKVPSLEKARFEAITEAQIDKIDQHDLGVATLWSTAYVLMKTKKIPRKYYFIQDNETSFYPKGSISALVDMSYRFGFYAIANTEGLLEMYRKNYGGRGTVLQSKVDLRDYYPRKDMHKTPTKPYKVFFYARPNMPRNAFELGVAGLKRLKYEMGDDVEIITAGAPWKPTDYGVEGLFTNLGKIDYKAVPSLYRSVDAGLMFMFSGHPGVTASELMASGCPVVVNEYDDITWNDLYQHEKTCLITKPSASEVARNIKRCLTDELLRKTLITNGLKKTKDFYGGYEEQLDRAYQDILNNYNT